MKGFHITSKKAFRKIENEGLKGSKWEENFEDSNSNPFELFDDGAVFCWPSEESAISNFCYYDDVDDCVLIELEGDGVVVNHSSEGVIHVLRADSCDILAMHECGAL